MNVERRLPYWNSFVEFSKKHNLVFGFDFDGILFEPRIAVSKRIYEDFRVNFPPEKMNTWTAVKDFLLSEGIYRSESRAQEYDNWIWTNGMVLLASPKVPGAFEITRELTNAGIEYYVYTSRLPVLAAPTLWAIRTHMPHIDLGRVHIRKDKNIDGDEFKALMPRTLGVNVHIDDSPTQSEKIAESNPACKVIVCTNSDWQPSSPNMLKVGTSGRLPNFFDFYNQVIKYPENLLV